MQKISSSQQMNYPAASYGISNGLKSNHNETSFRELAPERLKKYFQCRLKIFVLYPLFLTILILGCNFAIASGNFVRISLPKGVDLDFPQNWIVLSSNQRIRLDKSVESRLDLSDLDSKLPFAANYYNDAGETIGIANVRYYPNIDLTQTDARQTTSKDVNKLDTELKKNMLKPMKAFGIPILSWNGTKKVDINGLTTFITEYRRKSLKASGTFRVRLIRVLAKKQSFTLTVSYLESTALYLAPITDRIIKSIKMVPQKEVTSPTVSKVTRMDKEGQSTKEQSYSFLVDVNDTLVLCIQANNIIMKSEEKRAKTVHDSKKVTRSDFHRTGIRLSSKLLRSHYIALDKLFEAKEKLRKWSSSKIYLIAHTSKELLTGLSDLIFFVNTKIRIWKSIKEAFVNKVKTEDDFNLDLAEAKFETGADKIYRTIRSPKMTRIFFKLDELSLIKLDAYGQLLFDSIYPTPETISYKWKVMDAWIYFVASIQRERKYIEDGDLIGYTRELKKKFK